MNLQTFLVGCKTALTQKYLIPTIGWGKYIFTPISWRRSWEKRLEIKFQFSSDLVSKDKIAIFVVYSSEITQSVKSQLELLTQCGFSIILVSNKYDINIGKTPQDLGIALKVNRVNIGQDIGAYKDIILYLRKYGLLHNVKYLALLNDTLLAVDNRLIARFGSNLAAILKSDRHDVIALFENFDLHYHLQSFFLVLSSKVFNSESFEDFWLSYRPITLREHAIDNGEVKFTSDVLSKYKTYVIASSYELRRVLFSNLLHSSRSECVDGDTSGLTLDNYWEIISHLLPSSEGTLISLGSSRRQLADLLYKPLSSPIAADYDSRFHFINRLIFELERGNQSHIGSLLYSWVLGIPYLKKDICLHNMYSFAQVVNFVQFVHNSKLLHLEPCLVEDNMSTPSREVILCSSDYAADNSLLKDDIVSTLRAKGLSVSQYDNSLAANISKGIYPKSKFVYPSFLHYLQ